MQKPYSRWCFLVLALFLPLLSRAHEPLVTFHCNEILAEWLDLEKESMPWTVTWTVDDLQFAGDDVCDFTEKWRITGESLIGSAVNTVGSSFHCLEKGKGSHPFAGFENFATLDWWEKHYTDVDPMLSFGYLVWQKLDEHPALIPPHLRDGYEPCAPFEWPGDVEEVESIWDGMAHLLPLAEFMQTPHPFVETLLQDKDLINYVFCLLFPEGCLSWFSRWEVDEKGCLQAFEWHRQNLEPETHQVVRYDRSSCLFIDACDTLDDYVDASHKFWIADREVGDWMLGLPEHDDFASLLDLAGNPGNEERAFRWMVYLLMYGFMPDLPLDF